MGIVLITRMSWVRDYDVTFTDVTRNRRNVSPDIKCTVVCLTFGYIIELLRKCIE